MVAGMETLFATRYQSRMLDDTPTRRMLAKAAYGDTDFGEHATRRPTTRHG